MRLACWQPRAAALSETQRSSRLADAARTARREGADLLVTPELALSGYPFRPDEVVAASDAMVAASAAIARDVGITLVVSYPEWTSGGLANCARTVRPDGTVAAVYHKTHLFGPLERDLFVAGECGVVQFPCGDMTVGLAVCYDIEFPELARAHALRGTDLLVVPAALEESARFVVDILVPARAFENQFHVAYVNWAGRDGRHVFAGCSRVAGPEGAVATASGDDEEVLVATITAARKTIPYLVDRRPGLYADLARTLPMEGEHS